MVAALSYPEMFASLIVVDVAPVNYSSHSVFQTYLEIMEEAEARKFASRNDVDTYMRPLIPVGCLLSCFPGRTLTSLTTLVPPSVVSFITHFATRMLACASFSRPT